MRRVEPEELVGPWGRRWRRLRPWLLAGLVVFVGLQLVPYGREHPNPPVTRAAPWPDGRAAAIAESSCAACHSNTTSWPWYSYVAPASWLVQRDVLEGRDELNFSTWDRDDGEADDAIETIVEGSMPPLRYVLMHPSAGLSQEETQILVDALREMDD